MPVVFMQTPIRSPPALIANLARPGHGIPRSSTGTNAKWLEVLREIVSRATQTAVLRDPAIHEGLGQFP